jgi:hypothetical protein
MTGMDTIPSVWRYGLALLIVIAGFGAFTWYLTTGISSSFGGLSQMAAPGVLELDLKEPGEYTIFYENKSYFNGSFYMTVEQIPGLQIMVMEKSSGRRLQTYPAPTGSTYSIGGRSGQSFMAFRAEDAGIHVINASYPSGPGPKVILAVGNEVMEDLLRMIMVSMTLILVSLLIAAIITYTTYKGRKKALEAER